MLYLLIFMLLPAQMIDSVLTRRSLFHNYFIARGRSTTSYYERKIRMPSPLPPRRRSRAKTSALPPVRPNHPTPKLRTILKTDMPPRSEGWMMLSSLMVAQLPQHPHHLNRRSQRPSLAVIPLRLLPPSSTLNRVNHQNDASARG